MTTRNAFAAFDLEADAATIDTLRTDLAFALRKFIEASGMGQAKIGEILGLRQNVVSQICRGRVQHLSVERLIRAMVRAKIPGFVEWGASAEDARARVSVRVSPEVHTTISVADTVGTVYQQNWVGKDEPIQRRGTWGVKSSTQFARAKNS
jgi:predicted XRE-type DNA-binding protein